MKQSKTTQLKKLHNQINFYETRQQELAEKIKGIKREILRLENNLFVGAELYATWDFVNMLNNGWYGRRNRVEVGQIFVVSAWVVDYPDDVRIEDVTTNQVLSIPLTMVAAMRQEWLSRQISRNYGI